jgi:hypothetical protein
MNSLFKLAAVAFVAAFFAMMMTSCATAEQLAKNLGQKHLDGNGLVSIHKVTIADPETGSYTPELFSLLVTGRFTNILKDANLLKYDKVSSPAWYNASNVTTSETLILSVKDTANLADTLKQLNEVMKTKNSAAGAK